MELFASTPSAESRAIGLWQSVHASPRSWCTEPIQSWRAPPLWHDRHTPVCVSMGVFASRVKAMIRPGPVLRVRGTAAVAGFAGGIGTRSGGAGAERREVQRMRGVHVFQRMAGDAGLRADRDRVGR